MKKNVLLVVIGFTIFTGFNMPTCLTDYRDVYVGSYFCQSTCIRLNANARESTASTDTISLSISKDPQDSILQIKIKQQIVKVILVNKAMKSYLSSGHPMGDFFATDSLRFSLSSLSSSYSYIGKKK